MRNLLKINEDYLLFISPCDNATSLTRFKRLAHGEIAELREKLDNDPKVKALKVISADFRNMVLKTISSRGLNTTYID